MISKEIYATNALAAARNDRGMNQQEMADLLSIKLGKNISLSSYQKWEYGTRPISTDDAFRIARELRIPNKVLWEGR